MLDGRAGDDVISALGGDDFVKGQAGRDTVDAGDGNDLVLLHADADLGARWAGERPVARGRR